jgi:hypothetical protein
LVGKANKFKREVVRQTFLKILSMVNYLGWAGISNLIYQQDKGKWKFSKKLSPKYRERDFKNFPN